MIKRDGNAEPVARAQPRANADRRAIVEDVAVRERDAFRPPRRAAGELDIDGVERVGGDIVQDRQMARRYIVKQQPSLGRTEERRVGKERVSTCSSRGSPGLEKK